ncbi:hypothetical protein U1Q18_001753 [Sarracenia purpurea var. burkii]
MSSRSAVADQFLPISLCRSGVADAELLNIGILARGLMSSFRSAIDFRSSLVTGVRSGLEPTDLVAKPGSFTVGVERILPEPLPSFPPFLWFVGVDILADEITEVETVRGIQAAGGSTEGPH